MEKELKIRIAPVTIQVITVDGKRMTKSVFNQIEPRNPFDREMHFLGDEILGYVSDKGKHLIWINDGKLRRWNLNVIQLIARLNDNSYVNDEILNALWAFRLTVQLLGPEDRLNKIENAFSNNDDHERFESIRSVARSVMKDLSNAQLFISI